MFGSVAILTNMCVLFPPTDVGEPLNWALGARLVIAQLARPALHTTLNGLADLFARDADELDTALQDWLTTVQTSPPQV